MKKRGGPKTSRKIKHEAGVGPEDPANGSEPAALFESHTPRSGVGSKSDSQQHSTSPLPDGALSRARRAGLVKSAEIIQEPAEIGNDISGATIADPAFINFHTAPELPDAEPRRAGAPRAVFWRRRIRPDREVQVEVLAPGPEGPLTFEDSRNPGPADTASPLFKFKATGYQAVAILAGLGLLSGSMFLLGLAAGNARGPRQEGSERSATVYQLQAPMTSLAGSSTGQGAGAAAAKSRRSASTPASVASSPAATTRVATAPRRAKRAARVAAAPRRARRAVRVATAAAPRRARRAAPAVVAKARPALFASSDSVRGAPETVAPVPLLRRKGYSIQIEEVTDQGNADRMVAKLRHLGYQGYMVATPRGAEIWYKVRVGPFANEDAAQWAEAKLRGEGVLDGRRAASPTNRRPSLPEPRSASLAL